MEDTGVGEIGKDGGIGNGDGDGEGMKIEGDATGDEVGLSALDLVILPDFQIKRPAPKAGWIYRLRAVRARCLDVQ
jgi:hypothetical protein